MKSRQEKIFAHDQKTIVADKDGMQLTLSDVLLGPDRMPIMIGGEPIMKPDGEKVLMRRPGLPYYGMPFDEPIERRSPLQKKYVVLNSQNHPILDKNLNPIFKAWQRKVCHQTHMKTSVSSRFSC